MVLALHQSLVWITPIAELQVSGDGMITVVEDELPAPDLQPEDSLPPGEHSGPDLALLTDKVPEAYRMSRAVAGMVLVLGLVYLFCCSRPIWHTDVWGHLSYGRYIWETKSLPTTEPLLPLAKGVPFVDSPWLSQLIGLTAVSSSRLQLAGLQGLFAIGITLCCALLAFRAYSQTKSGWFATLTIAAFLIVSWIPLSVLRPQLAGLACFVYLLVRLTSRQQRASDWVVIPMLFAFWANLHASFPVGLLLLGCFCAGRAVDVLRRTGSVRAAIDDAKTKRYFLLTELAAVAVLMNPYGLRLYVEVLRFSGLENLQDLTEWHPLTLRDDQGPLFVGAALLLVALYRVSPRRVQSWEVLALVGLGLATLHSSRMLIWWAPVAALLIAQHGYAAWRKWNHAPLIPTPSATTGKWSFVTVGLVWISFMLSPLGIAVIHGKHTPVSRSLSSFTPVFAAQYLNEHPPQGQVFNTYEWGDYLQWAGPKGMQLFVNSHAHLIPRDVWMAYMQIIEQRSGWEETLDKYGINTIVVDMANRESLIKKLKEDDKWQLPPEERDGQVIFTRKKPILSGAAKVEPKKAPNADAVESKTESH